MLQITVIRKHLKTTDKSWFNKKLRIYPTPTDQRILHAHLHHLIEEEIPGGHAKLKEIFR